MKGDFTIKLLEIIGEIAGSTTDLFAAFLEAGYGASQGRLRHELSRLENRRTSEATLRERHFRLRKRYRNLLDWLKRDELIKEYTRGNKKFFILTPRGKKKLIQLKERSKTALPDISYAKKSSNQFVIVTFDIPEIEKRKRQWLRFALQALDFTMLQKSVWIGKTKIPKELLDDLLKLHLVEYVEIFEISKTGSLRHII